MLPEMNEIYNVVADGCANDYKTVREKVGRLAHKYKQGNCRDEANDCAADCYEFEVFNPLIKPSDTDVREDYC